MGEEAGTHTTGWCWMSESTTGSRLPPFLFLRPALLLLLLYVGLPVDE